MYFYNFESYFLYCEYAEKHPIIDAPTVIAPFVRIGSAFSKQEYWN